MPRPRVDLLLALPRPLQLARMLPAIAQLGVGTLVLTNAAKVEVGVDKKDAQDLSRPYFRMRARLRRTTLAAT